MEKSKKPGGLHSMKLSSFRKFSNSLQSIPNIKCFGEKLIYPQVTEESLRKAVKDSLADSPLVVTEGVWSKIQTKEITLWTTKQGLEMLDQAIKEELARLYNIKPPTK